MQFGHNVCDLMIIFIPHLTIFYFPLKQSFNEANDKNMHRNTLDPVEASLARVDELIRYSHTIASGNHNTIHTPTRYVSALILCFFEAFYICSR